MGDDPKTIAPGGGENKPRSQVVTGRLTVSRAPRASDEAAQMLRAGRFAEAVDSLNFLVREKPDDYFSWKLLAQAEKARHQFEAALVAANKAFALRPELRTSRLDRAKILSDLGDYGRSLPLFEELHRENPVDISALNGLKTGHYKTGNIAKALEFGGRALRLLDQGASAINLPRLDRVEHESVRRKKRVLAFTLFGANPAYLLGAMINVRMAHYLFPGWSCRIYVGDDVPPKVVADLVRTGAEVISGNVLFPDIPPYFWRFLVADEPNVRLFVCRDCDARLTVRDVIAVATWLDRGRPFHVVRDHVLHNTPILAGLWGGYAAYTWNMRSRIKDFLVQGMDNTYGADQRFLANCIWPLIRDHCVSMDRHYSLAGSEPIPEFAMSDSKEHMGTGVVGAELLRKEAALFGIPWPIA